MCHFRCERGSKPVFLFLRKVDIGVLTQRSMLHPVYLESSEGGCVAGEASLSFADSSGGVTIEMSVG